MSWFETALEMVTRTTIEVTVKNAIAQITKEFYGYGPRIPTRCLVQGPLILHVTPAAGSGIMDELSARPAGQVVMHFNNQLLVARYRDRLADLARLALRTELVAMFCDFDAPGRRIVGGSLLGRPLNRDHGPADPRLSRVVRDAVAALGGPAEVEVAMGPGGFWACLSAAGWVPAAGSGTGEVADAAAALAALARWRDWRDELTQRLRAGCSAAGVEPEAVFAGLDGGRLVVGGVLP